MYLRCSLLLSSILFATASRAEPTKRLVAPRGAAIEIIEEAPPGNGPFPVLIVAPGQAFPMRLPLLASLSRELLARGVAVVRFDWAYYTRDPAGGSPSPDIVAEVEDLETVLAYVRDQARYDRRRMAVGGKSFGSRVAWKVLQARGDIEAGLLLTPLCGPAAGPSAAQNYPGLEAETRPLAFILGDADPLCAGSNLYRAVAGGKAPIRLAVIGGDHSFGDRAARDPAAQAARNTGLAVQLATDFVANALQSRQAR